MMHLIVIEEIYVCKSEEYESFYHRSGTCLLAVFITFASNVFLAAWSLMVITETLDQMLIIRKKINSLGFRRITGQGQENLSRASTIR